jgi:hypothetical protein
MYIYLNIQDQQLIIKMTDTKENSRRFIHKIKSRVQLGTKTENKAHTVQNFR